MPDLEPARLADLQPGSVWIGWQGRLLTGHWVSGDLGLLAYREYAAQFGTWGTWDFAIEQNPGEIVMRLVPTEPEALAELVTKLGATVTGVWHG